MGEQMFVSKQWLAEHALKETKVGWEGPRWRLPRERQDEASEALDNKTQRSTRAA